MIAGWVVLVADDANRVEVAESAHWGREDAIKRAATMVEHGLAQRAMAVKLDPYGGEMFEKAGVQPTT